MAPVGLRLARISDRRDPKVCRQCRTPRGCERHIQGFGVGHDPVELLEFIETLETCLGVKAQKNMLPMQPGDVPATFADVDDLTRDVGFRPSTPLATGIERFVAWYRDYYGKGSVPH